MVGGGEVGASVAIRRGPGAGGCQPAAGALRGRPPVTGESGRGEKAVAGEECVVFGPGLQLGIREGLFHTCQPSTCVQRPPCTRRRPPLCGRETVHSFGRLGVGQEIVCVCERGPRVSRRLGDVQKPKPIVYNALGSPFGVT